MAVEPGVPYYISFYDLNPSNQRQCIFLAKTTQNRCSWDCRTSDNERAIELYEQIIDASSGIVSLDLLKDYILCNCCRSGRAQHRDRIQYIGHLEPLAERWQKEILEREGAASLLLATVEEISFATDHASTLVVSTASVVNQLDVQSCSTSTPLSDRERLSADGSTLSETVAAQSIIRPTHEPLTEQRYNLRPRNGNDLTNLAMTRTISRRREGPLPEFVPHVNEPHLYENSVASKLLNYLVEKEYDFREGALYVFSRSSSPGHVKIGWTSRTVQTRLDEWSECGYTPNLLFSVHNIPNAHRAETLVHHELVMEWRREGICKAAHCRKSHEEWFEIGQESAEKVVGEWAEFMKRARPYDSTGKLRSEWMDAVQDMTGKGETITARKLLDRYEASVAQYADLARGLETIVINDRLNLPKSNFRAKEVIETTLAEQMSVLRLEPLASRPEELSLRSAVPKKDLLLGTSLSETNEVKCASKITAESLLKAEFTFTDQSSVTDESVPRNKPSFGLDWWSQASLQPEPAPQGEMVSEAFRLPSSEFNFRFHPLVEAGLTGAERSTQASWLFGARLQTDSLASKDAAQTEPLPEYIRRSPSPIGEELRPEEVSLPPSPPLDPTLLQLVSDLTISQYQSKTMEPQAEPKTKESDDETTFVGVECTTLLGYDDDVENSDWDADKTLVENLDPVSLQTCSLKAATGIDSTPIVKPASVMKVLDGQAGLKGELPLVKVTALV